MYKRNCPNCKKELTYKHRQTMDFQEKNKKLCRSCTVKAEYKKDTNKNKGTNNGRSGKKLIDIMISKYGNVDGKIKYDKWKSNLNKFGLGELNPQYGKSPFLNGGMSYKGWYHNIFFRSSFELMFLVEYDNREIISAENSKFRVRYEYMGRSFFYYPDFYSKIDKTIYEIKSKMWISNLINQVKIDAAKLEFESRGIGYLVLCEDDLDIFKKYNSDWQKIIYDFIFEMVINCQIKLTDISMNKLKSKLLKTKRITKLNKLNMIH